MLGRVRSLSGSDERLGRAAESAVHLERLRGFRLCSALSSLSGDNMESCNSRSARWGRLFCVASRSGSRERRKSGSARLPL